MRLSRPRVALRALLLAIGGIYMWTRAAAAWSAARALGGSDALLSSRMAMIWLLVGALALLTAASAAWSLRRRSPRGTLHLGDLRCGKEDAAARDEGGPR